MSSAVSLDVLDFGERLTHAASVLNAHTDELCSIDSRFGDGDHGVTIGKIAMCITLSVKKWDGTDLKGFLDGLGNSIMGLNAGSAGPLWGIFMSGLGLPLEGVTTIDAACLKKMLESGLAQLMDITPARVGDKTMMDALIPAVEAASQTDGNNLETILQTAAEAARKGARASEQFIARYGRAKNYKDQTLGTPDAGAVSMSLFFMGLAGAGE